MKNLKKVIEKIHLARKIAIAGHVNPDGDSIGSLLSLGIGLKSLGKTVYMISADGVPKKYAALPGADKIRKTLKIKPDLTVTVDCNKKNMLGKAAAVLLKADTVVEIDHHEVREPFGDMALIDCGAPSVGEIIYTVLKKLKVKIDRDIAKNILTSVIVETNSFRLPNVRPFTFEVCAELVKTGLDFYQLTDMVFWSHSKTVTRLSGLCLSRCKFSDNDRLAWTIIGRKDFKRFKGKDEDVDAVPDEIRSMREVDIAIFFREKTGKKLRVSLRSKKDINVARLAEHYGGGGHVDVAGCVIPNNRKAINDVLERARQLL